MPNKPNRIRLPQDAHDGERKIGEGLRRRRAAPLDWFKSRYNQG